METIKCPACGTSNSAKRQICHICGQLLLQSIDQPDTGNIELLNDDLKAATEAALKDVVHGSGSNTAGRVAAREEKKSTGSTQLMARPRTRRDRNILVFAVIVTVAALGFLAFYLIGANARGSSEEPNKPRKVIGPSSTGYTPTTPHGVTPSTHQPLPAVTPSVTPVQKPGTQPIQKTDDRVQAGIAGASSALGSIVSRINADIGASLSATGVTCNGTVSQSGDNTIITVTMQGANFTGSVSILLQKLNDTWQPMYGSNWNLAFTSPVTLQNAAGEQQTFSGATMASSGYQPLSEVASQPISYY